MNETEFQKESLIYLQHQYPNHNFFWNFPLEYAIGSSSRKKDTSMPNNNLDYMSIDDVWNFHIREYKILHCDELIKWKTFWQLAMYDFMLSSTPNNILESKLKKHSYSKKINKDIKIKSRNIVVCWWDWWEISAGINPIMRRYTSWLEKYMWTWKYWTIINVFQFYKFDDWAFDLRNIRDMSVKFDSKWEVIYCDLHPDVIKKYLTHYYWDEYEKSWNIEDLIVYTDSQKRGIYTKEYQAFRETIKI